ncbi:hypothetical protein FZC35_01730 [Candidatus Cytomitobacter indipagum]|uniref:Uncharacterized protein n=1 Tax=Candidatus Cytomitobacter indipagum TaxID=2601575 RepID=A0A5C0UEG9_9PROT|nr:hypothetical protein [Candidatus Cytomitobacter indipagum]QEK38090.1 hypothetical protein FZC35_01730 [Candidatus Cytomitobacter indipagum]
MRFIKLFKEMIFCSAILINTHAVGSDVECESDYKLIDYMQSIGEFNNSILEVLSYVHVIYKNNNKCFEHDIDVENTGIDMLALISGSELVEKSTTQFLNYIENIHGDLDRNSMDDIKIAIDINYIRLTDDNPYMEDLLKYVNKFNPNDDIMRKSIEKNQLLFLLCMKHFNCYNVDEFNAHLPHVADSSLEDKCYIAMVDEIGKFKFNKFHISSRMVSTEEHFDQVDALQKLSSVITSASINFKYSDLANEGLHDTDILGLLPEGLQELDMDSEDVNIEANQILRFSSLKKLSSNCYVYNAHEISNLKELESLSILQ